MIMSKAERKAYDRHIDNIMVQNDVLDTAKMEGRKEGRKETIRVTAKNLKAMGLGAEAISQGAATLYPGLCSSALTARTAYVIRFYVGQKGWIETVLLY